MKKFFYPLFLTALIFTSCDNEDLGDIIDIVEPKKGNLEGSLFFNKTKIPVENAKIKIKKKEGTSDSQGIFSISDIPVGNHQVEITKSGFDSYTKDVSIFENETTEIIAEVTSEQFTCKLTGSVIDQDGNKMNALEVIILNPDGSYSELVTRTNSSGSFSIDDVPFGQIPIVIPTDSCNLYMEYLFIDKNSIEVFLTTYNGSVTDERDGNTYRCMMIGDQYWMVDNLRYLPKVNPLEEYSSKKPRYYVLGYDGSVASEAMNIRWYEPFGVLYNWPAAMDEKSSSNRVPSGIQGACPNGWHLPSDAEWINLEVGLGMNAGDATFTGSRYTGEVGKKLKSTSNYYWADEGYGDNSSGFTAITAGYYQTAGSQHLFGAGLVGCYWTSTILTGESLYRALDYRDNSVQRWADNPATGFSIRCIKD
jgi:uncharacterized protein (TIGR02145 family)